MKPGSIRVVQDGSGYFVQCPVHGRVEPEPGMVWASHVSAGLGAVSHALFVFHGEGAH